MINKILNVLFKLLSIFGAFGAGCLFTFMVEVMKEFNIVLFLGMIGGLCLSVLWAFEKVANTKEEKNT